jgi:hypothetical protein
MKVEAAISFVAMASAFEVGSTEGVGQRVEDFRIANKIYTKFSRMYI